LLSHDGIEKGIELSVTRTRPTVDWFALSHFVDDPDSVVEIRKGLCVLPLNVQFNLRMMVGLGAIDAPAKDE
jgi:hypothetical protein